MNSGEPKATTVQVERLGDAAVIKLPEEALTHLSAKVGDSLEIVRTPNGLLPHYHEFEFSKQMAAARHIMEKHRDVLRRLADS